MPLQAGTRLGPYEILAPLGAGGMGEVYRARDTRLGRDVAVKVLSDALSFDPAALERFEREARAAAALSHPNILALFDIGRDGASTYLVTELLDGRSLRDVMTSGPLPARKAIDYARHVALALAAAHDRGIVHRDIKPENIFITDDGRVKVLDFGLAQIAPAVIDGPGSSAETRVATTPGTILGTVGYMAPEQVRGQAVDARADIFALGAVLFEMLTGRRAFDGASAADVLSAILRNPPPEPAATDRAMPAAVDRLVRRCLEKPPAERFQSARDLEFALGAAEAGSVSGVGPIAPSPRRPSAGLAIAAGLVVLLLAGAFFAGRAMSPRPPDAPVVEFSIPAAMFWSDAASISPDGQYIVYTGGISTTTKSPQFTGGGALFAAGSGHFWLRRLDQAVGVPLPNTEQGVAIFFWSPDGKSLGYMMGQSVVVRELPDGAPRNVADVKGQPYGATWNARGAIVVGSSNGMYKMDASTGASSLFMPSVAGREIWRGWPSFLPDGNHFVFSVLVNNSGVTALETRIGDLEGREVATLMKGAIGASYVDGYLLYGFGGGLFVQAFDAGAMKFTGERIQAAKLVAQDWRSGQLAARASNNGVLVIRGEANSAMQFTWFDRAGKKLGTVGPADSFTNFSLSPDEKRIMTARADPLTGQTTLWLIDTDRGVATLVSDLKDPSGLDDPTWAPDGQHVAFNHGQKMSWRLANGGPEETLASVEGWPDSFSPDGRYIFFGASRGDEFDQMALDIKTPGAKPIPIVTNVTLSDESRISRNGRWVAYHANDLGAVQVQMQPFPPTGERWQISKEGGVQPRWSADGNELFYLSGAGQLMSVKMPDSDPRRAATPVPIFLTGLLPSTAIDQFAVAKDRFLIRVPASGDNVSAAVHVIVNWKARLGIR